MKADIYFKSRSLVSLIVQDTNLFSELAKNISYARGYIVSSDKMLILSFLK